MVYNQTSNPYNPYGFPEPSAPPMEDFPQPSAPPLYEETVQNVEVRRENPLKEEDCPICLDKLGTATVISATKCSHYFHQACLQGHLNHGMNTNCPMCRTPLAERGSVIPINLNEQPRSQPTPSNPPVVEPQPVRTEQQQQLVETVQEVNSVAGTILSFLGRAADYARVAVLNLLSGIPAFASAINDWKTRQKRMENMLQEQKEQIERLVTKFDRLPDDPHWQRALFRLDNGIKAYHDRMEKEHKHFMSMLAEIQKQLDTAAG